MAEESQSRRRLYSSSIPFVVLAVALGSGRVIAKERPSGPRLSPATPSSPMSGSTQMSRESPTLRMWTWA
jgi:hypothetical protein